MIPSRARVRGKHTAGVRLRWRLRIWRIYTARPWSQSLSEPVSITAMLPYASYRRKDDNVLFFLAESLDDYKATGARKFKSHTPIPADFSHGKCSASYLTR